MVGFLLCCLRNGRELNRTKNWKLQKIRFIVFIRGLLAKKLAYVHVGYSQIEIFVIYLKKE